MNFKYIMLVAGEETGDLLAARLVNELDRRKWHYSLKFYGMGGAHLNNTVAEVLLDSSSMPSMGIFERLKLCVGIHPTLTALKKIIKEYKLDLLVLVDYQEINQQLATFAKNLGIKVLFYVSPQVWASHPISTNNIRRPIDIMTALLPLEVAPYEKAGVPVRYVGHTLTEAAKPSMLIGKIAQRYKITEGYPTIGLFPGTRSSEIHHMLPTILKAAQLLHKETNYTQFLLPVAPGLDTKLIQQQIDELDFSVTLLQDENINNVIEACDVIITAAGKVTIEIALMETPMVVIYKMAMFKYLLTKVFLNIKTISLPNLITGKEVVKELLQSDATAENIAQEVEKISHVHLFDHRENMIQEFRCLKEHLNKEAGAKNIADLCLEMIYPD